MIQGRLSERLAVNRSSARWPERWWWLLAFCLVSLGIHVAIGLRSRSLHFPAIRIARPTEIEVALEPLPEVKPAPKPAAAPRPEPQPKPKLVRPDRVRPSVVRMARRPPEPDRGVPFRDRSAVTVRAPQPKIVTDEPRPREIAAEPGGVDPTKEEKPLPLGLPSGRPDSAAPRLERVAKADPVPGGGGSPAPGPVLGGEGGAPGPEAPPEDIVFNGGGAGGVNLPREAPRIGGGGGRSILSVENPLAKATIPEERPGLGPGTGGGQGAGGGNGAGVGRGAGIGTKLDGKQAIASLRAKPGPGIGASAGRGIGTRPPGGGRGTGAEQPGTGGAGLGYGRGSGVGVGNGRGAGVGDGDGGTRVARMRGVPFGDITGLLKGGDPNGGGGRGGGPGGPGRGAVFGRQPSGGGQSAPVHIVYLLDISRSMRVGDKFGRAKDALKKAIGELKSSDSFNIIFFYGGAVGISRSMISATPDNIQRADQFVDTVRLQDGTNISAALGAALSMERVTHIFLLSDGEPTYGIEDPDEMLEFVRQRNTSRVQIITLALGLGERFRGIELLKALAESNNGKFDYVNLSRP